MSDHSNRSLIKGSMEDLSPPPIANKGESQRATIDKIKQNLVKIMDSPEKQTNSKL